MLSMTLLVAYVGASSRAKKGCYVLTESLMSVVTSSG